MKKITADISANMKTLKRLEAKQLIEIHVVAIENHKHSQKVKHKQLPIAVYDGRFSNYGEATYAADDTPYYSLQNIIGKQHRADILHLEAHIQSSRDIFVTEDTDFLNKRTELKHVHGVEILTPDELETILEQESPR